MLWLYCVFCGSQAAHQHGEMPVLAVLERPQPKILLSYRVALASFRPVEKNTEREKPMMNEANSTINSMVLEKCHFFIFFCSNLH